MVARGLGVLGSGLCLMLACEGSFEPLTTALLQGSPPRLLSSTPTVFEGGVSALVTVFAEGVSPGAVLTLDGEPVAVTQSHGGTLVAQLPPHRRGEGVLQLVAGGTLSAPLMLSFRNTPPALSELPPREIDEEKPFELMVAAEDFDGDALRVFAEGLPPGARWDEVQRTLRFTPDFIQGGRSWDIVFIASDGAVERTRTLSLKVKDTIHPPDPVIKLAEPLAQWTRLTLSQTTDTFLDSPGYAGRVISKDVLVMVPRGSSAHRKMPVTVELHGFGGSPLPQRGGATEFYLQPSDDDNTYWWGYAESLPIQAPFAGKVPPYTARRVLHLLDWVLRTYPGADPERVTLIGGSMGGAGAVTTGLLWARHFTYAHGNIGQAIYRRHRPTRLEQLTGLWGSPSLNLQDGAGMGVWDRLDMTRELAESPEARDLYLSMRHAKDDPVIHFGAVTHTSPLTGLTFYQALQANRVGHYAIWDEGGHGPLDPQLGSGWWDRNWNRMYDPISFLRRDLPFPAFSRSSGDDNPGTGEGNGKQPWDAHSGYAGAPRIPLDTGWNGDAAGVINRWLRWDATRIVDTRVELEMPLRVSAGPGSAAPGPGYPSLGDHLDRSLPLTVDVTLRRVHHFQCLPGESLRWRYGEGQSGITVADEDGVVTVERLRMDTTWKTLRLERLPL